MLDGWHEDQHQQGEDHHGTADDREGEPPADQVAEGGAQRYAQYEGGASAGQDNRHGAVDLLLRHQMRGVGGDHRPEQRMRDGSDHPADDDQPVAGGEGGDPQSDREDRHHDQEESLATDPAAERGQRRTADHDDRGEDTHQQADPALADTQTRGHLRHQTSG